MLVREDHEWKIRSWKLGVDLQKIAIHLWSRQDEILKNFVVFARARKSIMHHCIALEPIAEPCSMSVFAVADSLEMKQRLTDWIRGCAHKERKEVTPLSVGDRWTCRNSMPGCLGVPGPVTHDKLALGCVR
jgi:hypothetical protein